MINFYARIWDALVAFSSHFDYMAFTWDYNDEQGANRPFDQFKDIYFNSTHSKYLVQLIPSLRFGKLTLWVENISGLNKVTQYCNNGTYAHSSLLLCNQHFTSTFLSFYQVMSKTAIFEIVIFFFSDK